MDLTGFRISLGALLRPTMSSSSSRDLQKSQLFFFPPYFSSFASVTYALSSRQSSSHFFFQENSKLARWRRNPFHQYEIFECICAENIATGDGAKGCGRKSSNRQEEEAEECPDEFLSDNGVSFMQCSDFQVDGGGTEIIDLDSQSRSDQPTPSKCSSDALAGPSTSRNKHISLKPMRSMMEKQTEQAQMFKVALEFHAPYSMSQYLKRLGEIENISNEAILAMHDELLHNVEAKVVIMTWDIILLRGWIELYDGQLGEIEVHDDLNVHASIGKRVQEEAIKHEVATNLWEARPMSKSLRSN